jgi:acetyl/propionyl-CoA carboxylase alpha subunit
MCIDRMERALRDYIILGTKTNVSWLRRVIAHPAFREGKVSTRFLADHEGDLKQPVPDEVQQIADALFKTAARPSLGSSAAPRVSQDVWTSLGTWGR